MPKMTHYPNRTVSNPAIRRRIPILAGTAAAVLLALCQTIVAGEKPDLIFADRFESAGLEIPRETTRSTYWIGNSLMSFDAANFDPEGEFSAPWWIQQIAQSSGDTHNYHLVITGGASYATNEPLAGADIAALSGVDEAFLVGTYTTNISSADQTAAANLQTQVDNNTSPTARFTLYTPWPQVIGTTPPFDPLDPTTATLADWDPAFAAWVEEVTGPFEASRQSLADSLGERILPVGRTLARLWSGTGPLASEDSRRLFFDSPGHLTPEGYWQVGLMAYMYLHGRKPTLTEASPPTSVTSAYSTAKQQAIVDFLWDEMLAEFGAPAAQLPPPSTDTEQAYYIGASMFSHNPGSAESSSPVWAMEQIASSAGITQRSDGSYTGAGSPGGLAPSILSNTYPFDSLTGGMDLGTSYVGTGIAGTTMLVVTDNNFTFPGGPSPGPGWGDASGAVSILNDALAAAPTIDRWFLYDFQADFTSTTTTWLNTYQPNLSDAFESLQDSINALSPSLPIRLIPAGRILLGLVQPGGILDLPGFDIGPGVTGGANSDLWYDDAPHQRPTASLILGAVMFCAIYRQPVPASFDPATYTNLTSNTDSIHPDVVSRWPQIRDYIWDQVLARSERVFGQAYGASERSTGSNESRSGSSR